MLYFRLGRKKTFTLSLAGMFASSFALVWVSAYSMYVVLRVLNGIFFSGSFLTAYIIGKNIELILVGFHSVEYVYAYVSLMTNDVW